MIALPRFDVLELDANTMFRHICDAEHPAVVFGRGEWDAMVFTRVSQIETSRRCMCGSNNLIAYTYHGAVWCRDCVAHLIYSPDSGVTGLFALSVV